MSNCKNRDEKCDQECLPEFYVAKCGTKGDYTDLCAIKGIDRLENKMFNKGLAFTLEERQFLGIHGLLPPVVKSEQQQIEHCTILVDRLERNLDKYMFLMTLSERNQRLFYQLVTADVFKYLPIIYTPTVGEACLNYGMIYKRPSGLFISIKDKGHVYDILKNWPEHTVRAITVTDGERILGLGDLGAYGMGIPIGKLMLYTVLGGINPQRCLPITLDCGTNRNSLILDPLYIGIREKRVRGRVYDEFLDEFMHAVARRFSRTVLIQFEDFGTANAFRLLDKYRNDFCCFNGDIQITAGVVLSGILVALKISKQSLKAQKILFFGAGEACVGIARLLEHAFVRNGVHQIEAKKRLWLFDTKGLVVFDRPAGGLTEPKLQFAKSVFPIDNFVEAIKYICPTILIGASAVQGAFTPEVLNLMAQLNETPIIFALSNPTNKSECTAKEAFTHTFGKCLFSAGSPFPPFEYRRKTYYTSQSNNSTMYPGIALGVLCSGMLRVPKEVFFIAAETLADLVTVEEMSKGLLYPSITKFKCYQIEIARWVMEYAYRFNLAAVLPEPENKLEFLKSQMYNPHYSPVIPEVYMKDDNR